MPRGPLVPLLALVLASCSAGRQRSDGPLAGKAGDIAIFLTTELRGQIEPCGCNSDPLGDLSRIAALLSDAARERPVLYLDGGSTLFAETSLAPAMVDQERRKAELIRTALPTWMGVRALGLGPHDLSLGPGEVKLPRQAANVDAAAGLPLEPPKVVEVGGVRVGVFGVVDPALVASAGIAAGDPAEAARAAIAKLRGQGAQLVVALAHMSRPAARKLAQKAPGADLVLVGHDAPDPAAGKWPALEPENVGGSWLVQPASKGQVVARLDVHVDAAGGELLDAIGEKRARARAKELAARAARLREALAAWEKDPSADPAFLSQKRAELAALEEERKALEAQPLRPPARGSWFLMDLVPIRRALRCDREVQRAKEELDLAIGRANLEAAKDEMPPPVPPGGAGFVGDEECAFCHQAAVDFWKGTKHAEAWATLERLKKQYDRSCVSCHVTGWGKPGGATLARTEGLRNVQCEACHGPGSRHVETDGKARETLVRLPEASFCATTCHTFEHSDTFQYEAYLRDVLGPGHGEALRNRLGDGPTGHELRRRALEKAGLAKGDGCTK